MSRFVRLVSEKEDDVLDGKSWSVAGGADFVPLGDILPPVPCPRGDFVGGSLAHSQLCLRPNWVPRRHPVTGRFTANSGPTNDRPAQVDASQVVSRGKRARAARGQDAPVSQMPHPARDVTTQTNTPAHRNSHTQIPGILEIPEICHYYRAKPFCCWAGWPRPGPPGQPEHASSQCLTLTHQQGLASTPLTRPVSRSPC